MFKNLKKIKTNENCLYSYSPNFPLLPLFPLFPIPPISLIAHIPLISPIPNSPKPKNQINHYENPY